MKDLEWCGGNEWADEIIEDEDDDEDPLKIPEVRLPARLCSKSLFRGATSSTLPLTGGVLTP